MDIPYITPTLTPELVLDLAERAMGVKSMALLQAFYASWHWPETPADYLMWIEVAAERRLSIGDLSYARQLRKVAASLHNLGITPSPRPWTGGV